MYAQSGGKGTSSAHAWLSDSTNIGAMSYLVVQTYEYGYHRISDPFIIEMPNYTWARMS